MFYFVFCNKGTKRAAKPKKNFPAYYESLYRYKHLQFRYLILGIFTLRGYAGGITFIPSPPENTNET